MKKIYTFENMIIYSSYIGKNKDLLLYCPDNQCFVYIKTEPVKAEILKIPNKYSKIIFSKMYYYENEQFIISDYKKNIYKVYPKQKSVNKIELNQCPTKFLSILNKISPAKVFNYLLIESVIVIKDENSIYLMNLKDMNMKLLRKSASYYTKIEFMEDIAVFSGDKYVDVVINKINFQIPIDKNEEIYGVKLIHNSNAIFLVTLHVYYDNNDTVKVSIRFLN